MAKKRKASKHRTLTITAEEARQLDAEARREARLSAELRATTTQRHTDKKKEARKKACRGKMEYQSPSSFLLEAHRRTELPAYYPHVFALCICASMMAIWSSSLLV